MYQCAICKEYHEDIEERIICENKCLEGINESRRIKVLNSIIKSLKQAIEYEKAENDEKYNFQKNRIK